MLSIRLHGVEAENLDNPPFGSQICLLELLSRLRWYRLDLTRKFTIYSLDSLHHIPGTWLLKRSFGSGSGWRSKYGYLF